MAFHRSESRIATRLAVASNSYMGVWYWERAWGFRHRYPTVPCHRPLVAIEHVLLRLPRGLSFVRSQRGSSSAWRREHRATGMTVPSPFGRDPAGDARSRPRGPTFARVAVTGGSGVYIARRLGVATWAT